MGKSKEEKMIRFWFDNTESANVRLKEYENVGSHYGEGRVVPRDHGAWFQFAEGLVVAMGENNYYDDSDFYAIVYCPQTDTFDKVIYASTRGWTYNNGCVVDADDDMIEEYRERGKRTSAIHATKSYILKQLVRCKTPQKGSIVTVTKGRKSRGVVGEIFWTGYSTKGYHKFGIRDANDDVHWVWASNVSVNIRDHKTVKNLLDEYSEGTKYMTASEIAKFIDDEISRVQS